MNKHRCVVEGCKKAKSLRAGFGLCNMHYLRYRKRGTLGGSEAERRTDGSIFNSRGILYKLITLNGVRKFEHIFIAEKALGHTLPRGACIHHVNGNGLDNRPENLVVCPNALYHKLLHKREKEVR